jgi:hypothetical protein
VFVTIKTIEGRIDFQARIENTTIDGITATSENWNELTDDLNESKGGGAGQILGPMTMVEFQAIKTAGQLIVGKFYAVKGEEV